MLARPIAMLNPAQAAPSPPMTGPPSRRPDRKADPPDRRGPEASFIAQTTSAASIATRRLSMISFGMAAACWNTSIGDRRSWTGIRFMSLPPCMDYKRSLTHETTVVNQGGPASFGPRLWTAPPSPLHNGAMSDAPTTTPLETPPDRLAASPRSPYYDAALLERGVGIRFKGQE